MIFATFAARKYVWRLSRLKEENYVFEAILNRFFRMPRKIVLELRNKLEKSYIKFEDIERCGKKCSD